MAHLTLHPYQRAVKEHILRHPGAGVFLDMGLGKTAVTLSAVSELMYDRLEIGKVLIIAPKRVAEGTWQDEIARWDFPFRVSAVLGTARQREKALDAEADLYIINRENTVWLMERYRFRPPFDMLILDESTSFKDASTRRWWALRKARGSFRRVVLLTGTPRPNSLMDLWAQVYLLDGGKRLGRTLTEYRNNYFVPEKQNGPVVYSYRVRNEAAEKEICEKISDICVSLKAEDYRMIPERLSVVRKVRLGGEALRAYKEMEREQVMSLCGEEITAFSAAAVSNKLLQLANGAVYTEDGKTVEVHRAKLEALSEIAEAGEPMLVFYAYRSDLARIRREFPRARLLQSAGDIREWNAGKIQMLLAHPASAGYGLNLQAGGHIIVWFGLTWSLEQYQQANARLARQGQERPVIIHHLVAEDTIDERVMRALGRKESGQAAMMDAIKLLKEEIHG